MKEKNQSYLLTESVGKLMLKYAVPCIISLLVGALYNIVDQIYIANADYLGSVGNAANTVVAPLTVIALGFAVMVGDGCCAFVSQALGAGKTDEAGKSVGNAILLTIVGSIIITAVYLIFTDSILTAFGGRASDEVFKHSKEYFFWISLGIPFYIFGQAVNPIIRSDGSPKIAMLVILLGAITNIILDPIFIYPMKMGMTGAAVATVLGQILTALLSLIYICKMKTIKLKKECFGFFGNIMKKFLSLGMTSFLAQISLVLSMAAVQNMCAKYGAMDEIFGQTEYSQIPLAVLGIVMKFFQIAISVAIGCAAGGIPVVGYNIGAKRTDRARKIFTYLLSSEALVGIFALLIVELLPHKLIGIFGASNESRYYADFAVKSFRIYLCMMPLAMLNKGSFIYLQALGKSVLSTCLSLTREIIFGVFLPVVMASIMGLDGLLWSFPTADILTFILALIVITRVYVNTD